MELRDRSNVLVSGARKCGTWASPASVQETPLELDGQEHLAGHIPAPSLGRSRRSSRGERCSHITSIVQYTLFHHIINHMAALVIDHIHSMLPPLPLPQGWIIPPPSSLHRLSNLHHPPTQWQLERCHNLQPLKCLRGLFNVSESIQNLF